jgi:hypothetical protein
MRLRRNVIDTRTSGHTAAEAVADDGDRLRQERERIASQLRKLSAFRDEGLLTREEFKIKKAALRSERRAAAGDVRVSGPLAQP